MRFRANVQKGGCVIAESVVGDVIQVTPGKLWYGSFMVPHGVSLRSTRYELHFNDGRIREMIVSSTVADSGGHSVANFVGIGEPP